MKNRLDMLARVVVIASEQRDAGRAQQLALAFFEIFEDARKMQSPRGVSVRPANSPSKLNRNHSSSLKSRIEDRGSNNILRSSIFNLQSSIFYYLANRSTTS